MNRGRMGGFPGGTRARGGGAPRLRQEQRPRDLNQRLLSYSFVIAATFGLFLWKVWVLQVLRGEECAAAADANHLKEREIPAPRGAILDANGQRIAEVRASFDLVVSPSDVTDPRRSPARRRPPGGDAAGGLPPEEDGAAALLGGPTEWEIADRLDIDTLAVRLSELVDGLTPEDVLRRWADGRKASRYRDIVLVSDLGWSDLERVLAARASLPGLVVQARHRRSYPDGDLFAHLLGYQREVRPDDLAALRVRYEGTPQGPEWYRQGDLIGKSGVEAAWEEWLRGTDGVFWVQVDAYGRELGRSVEPDDEGAEYARSLAHFLDRSVEPEVPGHDLRLTIRQDLQLLAAQLLQGEWGAVVMLEAQTGRVLALESAPRFDPEVFSRKLPPALWRELQDDPARPLLDKALQGVYPPGSTWKMLVAAAVIGSGTWDEHHRVSCGGGTQIGSRYFRCWNKRGHGSVDLQSALQGSCDVYFYKAGMAAGIDEVARYAEMFGMGKPSGIGINSEKSGINPSTEWKRRRYGERGGNWSLGDTASAVIGQGYTSATPMQMAVMTMALANGGTVYRPQLVEAVVAPDGTTVRRFEPEPLRQVELSPAAFEIIRRGMYAVVEWPGGTAHRQRLPELAFAGKTGTAQVVRLGGSTKKKYRDHAWFVAFAPFENPEVAIAVLVENGEHGSTAAAPIARQMFEVYFKDRIDAAKLAGTRIGVPPESAAAGAAAGSEE